MNGKVDRSKFEIVDMKLTPKYIIRDTLIRNHEETLDFDFKLFKLSIKRFRNLKRYHVYTSFEELESIAELQESFCTLRGMY